MIRKAVPYLVIVILLLVAYILGYHLRVTKVTLRATQEELGRIINERDQIKLLRLDDQALITQYARHVDSLRMALRIKPTTVIRYVDRETIIHDTTVVEVKVEKWKEGSFIITDSSKCWRWEGKVSLNPELSVHRMLFDFRDKEVDIYWQEFKHKFLFIKWGRQYYRKVIPECGTVRIEEVLIRP